MYMSRRGMFQVFRTEWAGTLSGALLAARGQEAYFAEAPDSSKELLAPPAVDEIRINSNENPLGPGKAVLDAIVGKFPEAGRYPFNSTPADRDLLATIAALYQVKPENVVLGDGSQEILKSGMRAFTSPTRGLVIASPSYETCPMMAKRLGHPLIEIKVDSAFRLDVEAMSEAAKDAGLVYICNPNNPTATLLGAKTIVDFVERIRRISPDTAIMLDEAYHDYVTDPSYQTAIPLALATPNVFVTRTFSKAYGMAGMRIGYAVGMTDTIKALTKLKMPYNVSTFGVTAAITALGDPNHIKEERARNTQVRAFTIKALEALGCKPTDSQANFVFVDIHGPAKDFREACKGQGVMVGRDFPPYEKTHARISIGTIEEMRKAIEVFRNVLRPATPMAGPQQ